MIAAISGDHAAADPDADGAAGTPVVWNQERCDQRQNARGQVVVSSKLVSHEPGGPFYRYAEVWKRSGPKG